LGGKYNMSDIMAAIGRTQLSRFESEFKPKRQMLSEAYYEQLKKIPGLTLLDRPSGVFIPHIQPVRVLGGKRDMVRSALLNEGIECGIHYKPNHLLTFFKRGSTSHLPQTESLYSELLTLPMQPDLQLEDVQRVSTVIYQALEHS
ncbi:MAG: aminotransferase, partial [Proteobacteria bacterium]